MHADRMDKISKDFDFKIIVQEGDQQFIARSFAQYRWFPKDRFNDRTLYCYGDKLAFLNFSKDDVKIMVMNQAEIASSFRELFKIAWDNVAILPEAK